MKTIALTITIIASQLLAVGCMRTRIKIRGELVKHDVLRAQRGNLRSLVGAKLAGGLHGEAFHVLEAYKSVGVLAFAPPEAPLGISNPLELDDLKNAHQTQSENPPHRGLKSFLSSTPSQKVNEPTGPRVAAFWAEQDLFNARAQLIGRARLGPNGVGDVFAILSVQELQRGLRLGELSLSYFVADDKVYVFVVTLDHFKVVELDASAAMLRQGAEELMRAIRSPADESWRAVSKRLYAILIEPLGSEFQSAQVVTIIPVGPKARLRARPTRDTPRRIAPSMRQSSGQTLAKGYQ